MGGEQHAGAPPERVGVERIGRAAHDHRVGGAQRHDDARQGLRQALRRGVEGLLEGRAREQAEQELRPVALAGELDDQIEHAAHLRGADPFEVDAPECSRQRGHRIRARSVLQALQVEQEVGDVGREADDALEQPRAAAHVEARHGELDPALLDLVEQVLAHAAVRGLPRAVQEQVLRRVDLERQELAVLLQEAQVHAHLRGLGLAERLVGGFVHVDRGLGRR
ncbi:MAG: hypothetical protein DYH12_14450, partial [Sorangiineae bacterium PRO1]|nr:hypothetical protein [Sorangiineae bacterium PRO1]